MKIQGVFEKRSMVRGWLYSGKVLAPNVSIVLYRNLLKYMFIKIVRLIEKMNRFGRKRGTDGFWRCDDLMSKFWLKWYKFWKDWIFGENYPMFLMNEGIRTMFFFWWHKVDKKIDNSLGLDERYKDYMIEKRLNN